MKAKNILIFGGVAALAIVGYFLLRNKKQKSGKDRMMQIAQSGKPERLNARFIANSAIAGSNVIIDSGSTIPNNNFTGKSIV